MRAYAAELPAGLAAVSAAERSRWCILFDGGGIRERTGREATHFDWEDWDVAVVTPRVMLTFRVPVLLFFPIYGRSGDHSGSCSPGLRQRRMRWFTGKKI